MDVVSQIVAEITNHSDLEGYHLLGLALTEQWKRLPEHITIKEVCAIIAESANKRPKTVYRAISRVSDDIYNGEESCKAVSKYCRIDPHERLTARELLTGIANHLYASYGAFSTYEKALYQPCKFMGTESYGILVYSPDTHMPLVTAPISDDLEKVKFIILALNQAKMPLNQLVSGFGLNSPITK